MHAELCGLLADRMSVDALFNVTGNGSTVVHQLTARGHRLSLGNVLESMVNRAGQERTAELINTQVGKHALGAVDTALRCNKELVSTLKFFGGVEMAAPEEWQPRRRRDTGDGTCNARSDNKRSQSTTR